MYITLVSTVAFCLPELFHIILLRVLLENA